MSEYISNTTTVKQVFDIFCSLTDNALEIDDEAEADNTSYTTTSSNRHFLFSDTEDYYSRVLLIVNNLAGELFKYSDTYDAVKAVTPRGKRVLCPIINKMTDVIPLDDYIARTVLPYGLGGILLADENPTLAAFLNDEYMRLMKGLESGIEVPEAMPIESVYDNGMYDGNGRFIPHYPYNEFSKW